MPIFFLIILPKFSQITQAFVEDQVEKSVPQDFSHISVSKYITGWIGLGKFSLLEFPVQKSFFAVKKRESLFPISLASKQFLSLVKVKVTSMGKTKLKPAGSIDFGGPEVLAIKLVSIFSVRKERKVASIRKEQ